MPPPRFRNVLALIPARQGSKSIPHKNIRSIGGKPMLAHSIEHALLSQRVTRVIVSTDSQVYADIAVEHGAEVPFLRPAELAQDHSTDLDVFQHALAWLREHENYIPDICVQLRPTTPVRNPADIDQMITQLEADATLDSVRSIVENQETPYKMWFREESGLLRPIITSAIKEAYNQPRQILPVTYLQTASIDVVRTSVITEKNSMTGERIYGYVMKEMYDIDYENQLERVMPHVLPGNAQTFTPKTFCFDIDGVIACITPNNEYAQAESLTPTADIVNALYDLGHYIILFTARGSKTGIDWQEVTQNQMKQWGVKYHELRFGKPAADFYIDDRMVSLESLKLYVSKSQPNKPL